VSPVAASTVASHFPSGDMAGSTSATDGVEAALEQLRVGTIEYRNGRTTAFELVRLGADVATSQERYSQALVSAAKAAADLRYLTSGAYTGTISR